LTWTDKRILVKVAWKTIKGVGGGGRVFSEGGIKREVQSPVRDDCVKKYRSQGEGDNFLHPLAGKCDEVASDKSRKLRFPKKKRGLKGKRRKLRGGCTHLSVG